MTELAYRVKVPARCKVPECGDIIKSPWVHAGCHDMITSGVARKLNLPLPQLSFTHSHSRSDQHQPWPTLRQKIFSLLLQHTLLDKRLYPYPEYEWMTAMVKNEQKLIWCQSINQSIRKDPVPSSSIFLHWSRSVEIGENAKQPGWRT